MQSAHTKSACSSLTLLVEHMAMRNAVLCVKNLRLIVPMVHTGLWLKTSAPEVGPKMGLSNICLGADG